jgi:hypothetical protein
MQLLAQFLLRLAFGLAVGMGITSSRQVTSGFFRNHLYVTLGLSTLAALVTYRGAPEAFWCAVLAAVASYVGSVCWLYEKKDVGKAALLIVAVASLTGTLVLSGNISDSIDIDRYFPVVRGDVTEAEATVMVDRARQLGYLSGILFQVANISSGFLLGATTAAMFLGHWYLNSPTMELAPLRRLLLAMGAAVILQAVVSAVGLACELMFADRITTQWLLFVLLRWLFGLVGVAVLTWMAWRTLEIPNTQSATGILYVAVIGVFVGELMAALLSAESAVPL